MSLIYVYSADVSEGNLAKFQNEASRAEKRLASCSPKGWRFRGIYVSAFGLGGAQVEIHWEVDDYSAFDNAVEEYASGGEYAEAVNQTLGHLDLGSQSARVLRAVGSETFNRLSSAQVLGL